MKSKQFFSLWDSKLSTNLGFVSCFNTLPLEALYVDVAKLSLPFTPLSPLEVTEDWHELQIQSGAKIKAREAQKQGYGIATCQLTPSAHALLPTATLGTGSMAKRTNPWDCRSLRHVRISQKFHVLNPKKEKKKNSQISGLQTIL